MSYNALYSLLHDIFTEVNQNNEVPTAQELWGHYDDRILPLAQAQQTQHEFVDLGNGVIMPKAVEALRILSRLRQRFRRDRIDNDGGDRLVGRVRGEAYLRQRPINNIDRTSLSGEALQIASLSPDHFLFSEYQVQGWQRVQQAIANGGSLVTIAPTGSGKTEVFLLPVIHEIAASLRTPTPKRFVLLYPRVPLLKDQMRRIFEYVHRANTPTNKPLIVGFQFTGIHANVSDTLNNRELFDEGVFQLIEDCPICAIPNQPPSRLRLIGDANAQVHCIQCENPNCRATLHLSLSKKDHGKKKPHLMVTTAESLDRFYLQPEQTFANYLRSLTGIVVDEVHLYQSLYGAHVHNIIKRIEQMRGNTPFTKIASSATISAPQNFIGRLFNISPFRNVVLHDADSFPRQPSGVEAIFFLQAPEEENRKGALSTLIQGAMAMGHGVLNNEERALVFSDSLDMVGSIQAKILDAEQNKGLWRWRTETGNTPNSIAFRNAPCPQTLPILCNSIYAQGECWRVIQGGTSCFAAIPDLRTNSLEVKRVSSGERADYRAGDMVVATSALEVGVDDSSIRSTIHYRPPIGGVFSFIQRRGRAGRRPNQVAYTVMVLGNTAADQYYFFRRHRLLNTNFQLPLNPNNPTVTAIHDRLREERTRMGVHVGNSRIQAGTWRWVTETLGNCSLITQRFQTNIDQLRRANAIPGRQILRGWIDQEKGRLEPYLNVSLALDEIEQDCPPDLLTMAHTAREEIDDYLSSPAGANPQAAFQALSQLHSRVSEFQFDSDQDVRQQADRLARTLLAFRDVMNLRQLAYPTRHAESAYFFFLTLEGLIKNDKILNMPIETMRIVLQALFYLHLGVAENEEGPCQVRMNCFVPENYFNEVKPIAIEVLPFRGSGSLPDLKQGQVTELSTLLIPYKPIYRFHNDSNHDTLMSLLDTPFHDRSEDGHTIIIESGATGLERDEFLDPKKIKVRPIETNPEGQQVVKICPFCCKLYNYKRGVQCHDQDLLLVKLFADPIVRRDYIIHEPVEQITRTLSFLQNIEGATTVRGSSVQARTVRNTTNGYVVTQDNALEFDALYRIPLRYSLRTRGIAWNLSEVTAALLENDSLRTAVEAVTIDLVHKTFNAELILHTAAHLLHKAVASIGGVNEQVLEYAFNAEPFEVVVWERTEGGTGISDIVEESIRANPQSFYKELLMSILCPVNLAESTADWTTPDELRSILNDQYGLSESDPLVNQLVTEALAERHAQNLEADMRFVCQQNDGCPACVQTTYCTARSEQSLKVSRLVGQALLAWFVKPMSREENVEAARYSTDNGIILPHIMGGYLETGLNNVLLL